MRFDFCIGNPPYQEETDSDSTRMLPIYDKFMDAAFSIGEKVALITPARFLFDAGQTPKAWNKKMLADEHLSVLYYELDASKVFPNTDIKGGVAITYHDADRATEPIHDNDFGKPHRTILTLFSSACYRLGGDAT